MYSRYSPNAPMYIKRNYIHWMVPDADDRMVKRLYRERMHLFELLIISIEMISYNLVLSLRATSDIDELAHLHVNDRLIPRGRDAMQEMAVIRLRELFNAEKDDLSKFRFHGFHKTIGEDIAIQIPQPNIETNNTIARIIRRRRFYSAHHGNGKNDYSFSKNKLRSLDLVVAISYIAKVEESLHQNKEFDVFERLLNDDLDVDRPLVWDEVYEALTGREPYIYDDDMESTPEFIAYQEKARREVERIRLKVQGIIN